MITFLKSGVKDSVTTLLLSLSVSDALFLIFMIPAVIDWQVKETQITTTLQLLFYWPAMTFYDYSSYISLFLGVIRCACVVKPLHFKSVFTKKRTVAAVIMLFCVDVLLHISVLSLHRLQWRKDGATNSSYLTVVRDFNEEGAKVRINDALNKNTIAGTSFIVMIACTALLSYKLFEWSKIRSLPASDPHARESAHSTEAQRQKLSPKDIQVVQSVVLVCTILS